MSKKHLFAVAFSTITTAASCALYPAPVITQTPPEAEPIVLPAPENASTNKQLRVTRIAHASVLLELGDTRVLTDPWFSEKTSYHHGEPLGIALAELPRLDAVIASHGHYDHFDIETFAQYPHKDVPMFVGPEMLAAARTAGFTKVVELVPWQKAQVGDLELTAIPAKHGVPEVTFILSAHGFTVYFAGDTLLIPELSQIPQHFPNIDLALLPINGLQVFGSQVVMNAEDAAKLAGILRARVAVPTHYRFEGSWFTDTFILSRDGTPERFVTAAKTSAPETKIRVLEPGQPLRIMREETNPAAKLDAPPR